MRLCANKHAKERREGEEEFDNSVKYVDQIYQKGLIYKHGFKFHFFSLQFDKYNNILAVHVYTIAKSLAVWPNYNF